MPRRRLLLLWSGSAPEGIFLDRFTTAQASLTAARTAEPGHGKWIIDNGSAFWIAAGRLRGGGVIGEATWGDESMAGTSDAGAGFARTPGRTLVAPILTENPGRQRRDDRVLHDPPDGVHRRRHPERPGRGLLAQHLWRGHGWQYGGTVDDPALPRCPHRLRSHRRHGRPPLPDHGIPRQIG